MGLFGLFGKKEAPVSSINLAKPEKISLLKERQEEFKIVLTKEIKQDIVVRVALVLDISGSMSVMYDNGLVQDILERIFPIARQLDDDNTLDMWVFSKGFARLKGVNDSNFDTYIEKEILNKSIGCKWGGTMYAPAMEDVMDYYKGTKEPAFVIFITDGENGDKNESTSALKTAANQPIFWKFIGIGYEQFNFLQKLDDMKDRVVDNADFKHLNDLSKISDAELYSKLLEEFASWKDEATKKNIIK